MIAPSRMTLKCSARMTWMSPVAVMKMSPQRRGVADRHDEVAVHQRLERADLVDLDHGDLRAHAAEARRDALAAPAVAGDDDVAPGDQQVRGPEDAVERGLAGAVAVVEEVLGQRLVDGHDRVAERAVGGHGLEPDDAGGRLLGPGDDLGQLAAPLLVDQRHQVAAVVHGHVRVGCRRRR